MGQPHRGVGCRVLSAGATEVIVKSPNATACGLFQLAGLRSRECGILLISMLLSTVTAVAAVDRRRPGQSAGESQPARVANWPGPGSECQVNGANVHRRVGSTWLTTPCSIIVAASIVAAIFSTRPRCRIKSRTVWRGMIKGRSNSSRKPTVINGTTICCSLQQRRGLMPSRAWKLKPMMSAAHTAPRPVTGG